MTFYTLWISRLSWPQPETTHLRPSLPALSESGKQIGDTWSENLQSVENGSFYDIDIDLQQHLFQDNKMGP